MDRLFAPWRIEYVERDDDEGIEGCPFCVLPEREEARESLVVAESERTFVLLNNRPYNPGHVMVIPRTHTGAYTDLDEETLFEHAKLKQRTISAIERGFGPDAINTGLNLGRASGGSIHDHLHTHVVPRWTGDTNFMPILSETKVIVQAVEETYDQLHEAFAADPDAQIGERGSVMLEF